MALTTTPDGIIYPTLQDQGDDIPAVFATMAGSIQSALTNLRNTINTSISNVVTVSNITTSNGYTSLPGSGIAKSGRMVTLALALTKGSIDAVNVGTIPAGLRPPAAMTLLGVASQGGAATQATVVVNTDGTIRNWTASPANGRLDIQGSWILPA